MRAFLTDPAPAALQYPPARFSFLWYFTIPFGFVLGLGLGLGLSTVSGAFPYYVVKEIVLGTVAGLVAPLCVPLARRVIPDTPDARRIVRRYLSYFLAGAGAGLVVLFVSFAFPLRRPFLDPANLLYLFGVAGVMPLIGFIADAVYAERAAKDRTRALLGQYVSESVAQRILETQSSPLLHSEIRNATVLISDIRGFTRMIQDLGAEEVVRTLNEYFTRMIDVIAQYDGTVNKFIGDAIVVLYNVPTAQPDANRRAVETARAMQSALQRLNAQRVTKGLSPVHIGIAIDAGEVVCGNIGSPRRLEYTAIGAPVNTAYHLAGIAPADTIYVTENVYRALDGAVMATFARAVELKGGTGTSSVYALE